jgi:hypothetical protein
MPFGHEIDLSLIPGKGSGTPPFSVTFRIRAADGTEYDAGRVECGRECSPQAVCGLLYSACRHNGWRVSWEGRDGGDTRFVVYGTTAKSAVVRVDVRSPHPIPVKVVPRQPGYKR